MDNTKIEFRQITEEDSKISYEIFLAGRPDLHHFASVNDNICKSIIKQQYELSQAHTNLEELKSRFLIIYEGKPIGRFYLRHNNMNVEITSLSILPQYRNMGIGRYVMEKIISNAKEKGKDINLKVAWYNLDARRLYERLGFKEIDNHTIYVEMCYMA